MERRTVGLSTLVVWMLCSCCVASGASGPVCPATTHTPQNLSLRDRGGLSALVDSAESTRSAVVTGDLPYRFIRAKTRAAYDNGTLSTAAFVQEWMSYTQNALFVVGFVVFLGLLLPGTAMALWTFWECCYEKDEEEEEENRNLTWQGQVVVWTLATAVVVVVIVLVVMVGILLGANSWMTQGVEESSSVVRQTIPQLIEMKQSALRVLNETLVERYNSLTQDIQTTILDPIPHNVNSTVYNEHFLLAKTLTHNVTDFLERRQDLLSLARSVTATLGTLHTLTTSLNHSLTLLNHTCSQLLTPAADISLAMPTPIPMPTPVTSSLLTPTPLTPSPSPLTPSLPSLCDEFIANFPTLVFTVQWDKVGGVSAEGSALLSNLQSLLGDVAFSVNSDPSPQQLFLVYLEDVAQKLAVQINTTSQSYFASLGDDLIGFTAEVVSFYDSSLPLQSQPQVELYLGARHLENWQGFRSALTITFAVLIFVASLALLLSIGRGMFFVTAIYRYADSAAYDHSAHVTGIFIKKVAFGLSLMCVISAIFTGFFLSVSGVMGKVCGYHNNFSEVLEHVVDTPHTWSTPDAPHYPLSSALLNMSEFPLTVGDTLNACRSNVSLFRAFHLEQRYDLEEHIKLNPLERTKYREDMQSIYLSLPSAELVSPPLTEQLTVLERAASVPVEWAELTELALRPLFQNISVEVEDLWMILEDMVSLSDSSPDISAAAETVLETLHSLSDQLQPSLSTITNNASQLQSSLSELSRLSPSTSLTTLTANTTLTARTSANLKVIRASEEVSSRLIHYLNTSIHDLTCHLGGCKVLATNFDLFTGTVCGDIVPGMDLYWTVFLVTFALLVVLLTLSLLVASRFVSLELQKLKLKNPKFHHASAVMGQVRGLLWQLVSFSVYLWWVVYVGVANEVVGEGFCQEGEAGCCEKCVWGFGVLFLCVSVGVGVLRCYQYYTVYRTKTCKAMKYRRFWIDRKKAVNFYGQLILFFLQDLPFLILVGVHAQRTFLSVPTFYALCVSLVGILTYLTFLLRERRNIVTYWAWLKLKPNKMGVGRSPNQDPPASANGDISRQHRRGRANLANGHMNSMRSPYDSSGSDHSENSSQGTHGFEFHPPRLSDIPEYPEGALGVIGGGGVVPVPLRMVPLEPHLFHNDDESEMSEQNSQFQSCVRLDIDVEPNSEAYLQRRRDAIDNFERGGVEVAPAHYRHRDIDASTISDSYYYGSRNSMELPGYSSSSQAQDTNSYYESSDCNENDGDSVYSQARYRLPIPTFMGEVTVDV